MKTKISTHAIERFIERSPPGTIPGVVGPGIYSLTTVRNFISMHLESSVPHTTRPDGVWFRSSRGMYMLVREDLVITVVNEDMWSR